MHRVMSTCKSKPIKAGIILSFLRDSMAAFQLNTSNLDQKDLLSAIIHKAKQAGFKFRNRIDDYEYFTITAFNPEQGRLVIVLRNHEGTGSFTTAYTFFFFEINFAKALFGEYWEQHLDALAITTHIYSFKKTTYLPC
jgi:hypothetical protein